MNRFREARDKGSAYLLERQRQDGSFGDYRRGAGQYYNVPIAFQVSGHSSAANRLCNWIRANAMTAEGDFGPTPERRSSYSYAYTNAWIVEAAHRLGQFDMSQRGMDFIMGFWDSESGGFYSSPTERASDTRQDLWVVSGCGRAALYTGRIEAARGVGRWMKLLMDGQPDYPKRMYTVYSRAGGLRTRPDSDDELRYVLSQDATRDQYFFHPGIAGGFLARLYQSTGEEEWLALAMEYMRFAEGASDYLFRMPGLRQGKVGWAASVLYTLTGERKYRDMAIRVGDSLIRLQSDEGYWWGLSPEREPGNTLTAEMVIWLDEVYQSVGHE